MKSYFELLGQPGFNLANKIQIKDSYRQLLDLFKLAKGEQEEDFDWKWTTKGFI